MEILDMRTGKVDKGEIVDLSWNFTLYKERVIVTLNTGFQITIYVRELDKIRPFPEE